MKTLFLIIILQLVVSIVNAQNKPTDREFDGLKGPVKSVSESALDFENQNGKVIEKQSGVRFAYYYAPQGNTSMTLNYIVGDQNIYSIIDGEKAFKTAKIKGFGGAGVSSAIIGESKPGTRDERYSIRFKYKYDNNRLAEEVLYDNSGELVSRRVYKYDEQGRIKESEIYNTYKSDKLTTREFFKYDINNNLVEKSDVEFINDGSDSKHIYSDYKFDALGNWIERTVTSTYNYKGKNSISKTIEQRLINYYKN